MPNVTYLIGAGASFGAIPLNDKLMHALDKLDGVVQYQHNGTTDRTTQFQDSAKRLSGDIKWLVNQCGNNSVDVLANKLSARGKVQDLAKVKNVLTVLFISVDEAIFYGRQIANQYDSELWVEEKYGKFKKLKA